MFWQLQNKWPKIFMRFNRRQKTNKQTYKQTNKQKQNRTKQNKTKQNKTKQKTEILIQVDHPCAL